MYIDSMYVFLAEVIIYIYIYIYIYLSFLCIILFTFPSRNVLSYFYRS